MVVCTIKGADATGAVVVKSQGKVLTSPAIAGMEGRGGAE